MKKNEILAIIIKRITENKNTYDDKFKDYYKACHYIYTVSHKSGFPFVSMDGKIYVYTGTHLEEVNVDELMMFLKFLFQKLSGDSVYCGKKELINGLTAQFPYTVMGLNVKQAEDKINFGNGTLDLKSGNLCKHNWSDYFRYVLPYNYDKNASCPMFMKYLNEVMSEKEAQDVLSEYVGWLFMPGLKLEKVLFLYGSGCNGKSVFVDIVEALLGKENISHESLSDLCGEYGANSRSNLAGKILNTCSDVAPNAFAGDLFKRIASGEPISTKILYKDVTTLTDYAKMIFCLNELPKTNDTSNGFYRRFLIAPFNVQIPKSKINPNLAKDIISNELPVIKGTITEDSESHSEPVITTTVPFIATKDDDIKTSRIRKNVLAEWDDPDNYVEPVGLFKFLSGGKFRKIDKHDFDEQSLLTLAVKESEIKGYMVLGYETGHIVKVSVEELLKYTNREYSRNMESKLIFASIADKNDAIITISQEDKARGKVVIRLDQLSNIEEGRLMDSGKMLFNEGLISKVLAYDIIPSRYIEEFKGILDKPRTIAGYPENSATKRIIEKLHRWGIIEI